MELKYGPNRERTIAGIRRVSKPGLRVYAKSTELPRVLGGLGVAIISTSSGLLTDRAGPQAKRGRGSPRLRLVRDADMSRIGRKPIAVPAGVDVKVDGQAVTVKGPKGELAHTVAEPITVEQVEDGHPRHPPQRRARAKALHGLTRTLVANMVIGVTEGYRKSLEIIGTGYRVAQKGSRPRVRARLLAPGDRGGPGRHHVRRSRATPVHVAGIDKQLVGEVAANIRKIRKPEPYKGKGVSYAGEVIRRKAGKAGKKSWHAVKRTQGSAASAPSRRHAPGAQEDQRHGRASAPGRHPFDPAHLRAGRRRRHRPHARVRVHHGGRPPWRPTVTRRPWPRKVGALVAERAKAAGSSKVVFDRGGNRYARPRRRPRRCRARSRTRVLTERSRTKWLQSTAPGTGPRVGLASNEPARPVAAAATRSERRSR